MNFWIRLFRPKKVAEPARADPETIRSTTSTVGEPVPRAPSAKPADNLCVSCGCESLPLVEPGNLPHMNLCPACTTAWRESYAGDLWDKRERPTPLPYGCPSCRGELAPVLYEGFGRIKGSVTCPSCQVAWEVDDQMLRVGACGLPTRLTFKEWRVNEVGLSESRQTWQLGPCRHCHAPTGRYTLVVDLRGIDWSKTQCESMCRSCSSASFDESLVWD